MRLSSRPDGDGSVSWVLSSCVDSSPTHRVPRTTIKHRLTRLIAGGALFLAATATPAATSPVGATPGTFGVSPSGAATYSIPIFVPPGTNGMAPQLSLNYNSQSGNGLLGMGWSVDGLSVIHRCGATIAIDGFKGGVNYDVNDRFCLEGERLIWDAANGYYHTKHESWQKIVAVGSNPSDPGSFKATAKDGTVYYFGATTNSRIEAQGKSIARLWLLNKVEDRNGNYLTITYTEDNANGDFRPASISYTGNGTTTPYNFVYFDYETRTDIPHFYEAGSIIIITQRLKAIRSCTTGSCATSNGLVRKYNFSYDYIGTVGRSRLMSVQECGSDGICLPATTFDYSASTNGSFIDVSSFNITTQLGNSTGTKGSLLGDFNGDGKTDVVRWADDDVQNALFVSNGDGSFTQAANFNITVNLGHSNGSYGSLLGDFNGDGKMDILRWRDNAANNKLFLSNGDGSFTQPTAFNLVNVTVGISTGSTTANLGDYNGDGKMDILRVSDNASNNKLYLSNGDGSFTPAAAFNLVGTALNNNDKRKVLLGDYNGDGKTDFVFWDDNSRIFNKLYLSNGDGSFTLSSKFNLNAVSLGGASPKVNAWLSDYNGDGKMDILRVEKVPNSEEGLGGTINELYLSKGDGSFILSTNFNIADNLALGATKKDLLLGDYNGDGKTDILRTGGKVEPNRLYLSKGDGSFTTAADFNLVGVSLAGISFPDFDWTGALPGDYNGDGKMDILRWSETVADNKLFIISQAGIPDQLVSIINGLGAQITTAYKPLTDNSIYTNDTSGPYACGTPYTCYDVQDASYVVSQYTQSNGIGGLSSTSLLYGGLKKHHKADTRLGFRWMQVTDPAGLVTKTFFNQSANSGDTLDCTEGTVAVGETWAGSVRVKYASNTWVPVGPGSGACYARLAASLEETRELDNTIVTTVNISYSGHDAYNNPGTIVVDFNDGWSKTTNNIYNNDTINWQLGQLMQSQVTAYAPGQSAQTRTSSFGYDSLGRLTSEVIEPNSSTLRLTTTYGGFNSFGQWTTKTVSGPDITTRTVETLTYDTRGQFVTSRKNALNHSVNFTYDARTGAMVTATDANNITTTFTYSDGFGRKTQESRPGSATTDIYYLCWNGTIPATGAKCPAPTGPAITAVRTVTAGHGENYVYSDLLGRPVQTNTQGFSGNWIYKTTQYDNLGRVISVSRPYYTGETVRYTTYDYYSDALGRPWKVTEPGPGNRTTTTTYNGLSATVTNPLSQARTTVKNSQGLVATVTDNAGTITNTYDPFGNLLRVAKSFDAGADVVMNYDIRGRKTSMTDPDMGYWTYNYNALSELLWQKDAKLQTINMTYDDLGRMKTRVLPNGEGTSTWTYDTATYGKGKLASVSSPSATETYVYDSLSRPSSVTSNIGGVLYTTTYTYDTYSRPQTLTYPGSGFKLYQVYDAYGHLTEVRKDTATGLRYWKADSFDAHRRLIQETLGNNLIGSRAYDQESGDLSTIQTGVAGNLASIQNSTYSFDAIDNLRSRGWWDGTAQRSESFDYDNLNRLTTVTGPANKIYQYHANGNITYKSDTGQYSYPTNGVRPHGVTSVVYNWVPTFYSYDANGNMITRAGKTLTYTAFNKPKTIQGASGTTSFTYDAHYNRLIKAAPGATTTYIGKLYEKVVSGATTTQRNYIYAGSSLVGVANIVNGGAPTTQYFHTDHLGSVEVISNDAGAVVQRLSYDAWGKRRNVNGTDATGITSQTTRGFTRHEHDDEIELVNMNAREYDPVLGRFISPDIIVQFPHHSQSYNRYAYVHNNPLSFTDPTGHGLFKWIKNVVKKFKQKLAHTTTHILHQVSGVNYVGGLLSTGLVAGTHFGYAYGWSTGDWGTVGQAHVQGAIITGTAYAFNWVGGKFPGFSPEKIFAHGFVGGTSSVLSGGDFRSGFIGSAFGAFATHGLGCTSFICSTASGGIGARLSGGKSKDGAVMAALGYMFNYMNHEEGMGRPADEQGIDVVVGDEGSKNGLKVLGGLAGAAGGPLVGAGQRGLVALMNSEGAIGISVGTWNLAVDAITTSYVAAMPVITNPAVQSGIIYFVEGATPGGPLSPVTWPGLFGKAFGDAVGIEDRLR